MAMAELKQKVNADVVDLSVFRTMTEGDVETEKKLISLFINQSLKNIEVLKKNVLANGYNHYWTENAHMLKGAAAAIGAEKLRKLSYDAQEFDGISDGRQILLERIQDEYSKVELALAQEGLV